MRALLLVFAYLAVACVETSTPGDENVNSSDPLEPGVASQCEPSRSGGSGWDHSVSSRIVAATGDAHHGASDVLAAPGGRALLEAKFAYGLVLKDLEDETIEVHLADTDCKWELIGTTKTDEDGLAAVELDALDREPGRYAFELVVRGDRSRARGTLWVIEAGRELAIFDIDGTMTTGDDEIVEEVLLGDSSTMFRDADTLVNLYEEQGYQPVFMTGRPTYFSKSTRAWLRRHGMPEAPVFLTTGLRQAVFSVEDFKRQALLHAQRELGLEIHHAYGNADTDICAYADAGIDPTSTFIIGKNAGDACDGYDATNPVTTYTDHLQTLDLAPARD